MTKKMSMKVRDIIRKGFTASRNMTGTFPG